MKRVVSIFLVSLLLLSISGCNTQQQDRIELQLAIGTGQYTEKWTQLISQFNESNETYCIHIVRYGNGEQTLHQLEMKLIDGTAPDILALPKDSISVQDFTDDIYLYLQDEQGNPIELLPFFLNTFPQESHLYRLPLAVHCHTKVFYQQNQEYGEFYPLQGINSVWHLRTLYNDNYSYEMESNSSYFVSAPMELEISVYSGSTHKDGVQAFIQYLLEPYNQLLLSGYDRFPVTKDAFDLLCEQALLGEVPGGVGFQLMDSDVTKLNALFNNLWIRGQWM